MTRSRADGVVEEQTEEKRRGYERIMVVVKQRGLNLQESEMRNRDNLTRTGKGIGGWEKV